MGGIAQLGEHLPYKQRVVGSSPTVPKTINYSYNQINHPELFSRGHSSAGRASALQAEGRRFKSCCPQNQSKILLHFFFCNWQLRRFA